LVEEILHPRRTGEFEFFRTDLGDRLPVTVIRSSSVACWDCANAAPLSAGINAAAMASGRARLRVRKT